VRRVGTEVFDLGVAPLLRVVHVRLGGRVDGLIVVLHHAVADAISTDIFMRELTIAYDARLNGTAPTWPALDVQYADFTAWQENSRPSIRTWNTAGSARRSVHNGSHPWPTARPAAQPARRSTGT